MDPIDYFYVLLAVVYALSLVYMVAYNLKVKRRQKALQALRHTLDGVQNNVPAVPGEKQQGQKHA